MSRWCTKCGREFVTMAKGVTKCPECQQDAAERREAGRLARERKRQEDTRILREAEERQRKERERKERETKEHERKVREAKEREDEERDARERVANLREGLREAKERAAKEREHKEHCKKERAKVIQSESEQRAIIAAGESSALLVPREVAAVMVKLQVEKAVAEKRAVDKAEIARLRSACSAKTEGSYARAAALAEQLHSRGLGPTVCAPAGAASRAREQEAAAADLSAWVRSMKRRSATAEADEKATLQLEEFAVRERLQLLMEEERIRIRGAAWDERIAVQRYRAMENAVLGNHSHRCAAISSDAENIFEHMCQVHGILKGQLGKALRAARITRITRIRIEGGSGSFHDEPYLRTFARKPEWVQQCSGTVLCFTANCFTIGDAELPCDPSLPRGTAEVALPDGTKGTISAVRGGAAILPLPDGVAPEDLRALAALAQRLGVLAEGGALARARAEAWRLREAFAEAQGAAVASAAPVSDGAAERRDAARVAALGAQGALLERLRSRVVQELASPEFEEELTDLERRLDACALAARSALHSDASTPAAGADVHSAAAAATTALEKLAEWQARYDAAVADAECRTDQAVAAARQFGKEGCPPLDKLAADIKRAAEAETLLRTQAEGVTAPPRGECAAAVKQGLQALSATLSAVRALRVECDEAADAREELAEGARQAEGGRFAARVARFTARDSGSDRPKEEGSPARQARQKLDAALMLESMLPREQWEGMCSELRQKLAEAERDEGAVPVSLKQLQMDADLLGVQIGHAAPERAAQLSAERDEILRQLRGLRRARAEEGAELLRLARTHFPESVREVCQGLHGELVRQLASKRSTALQLVVGGGSLSDYVTIRTLAEGRGYAVTRAESGSGTVVIKQVRIDSGPALNSFARGVRMMHAAGEVAATMHSVFVSDQWGCVVMEDYPHDLRSWSAESNAANLSPAAILRMVQQLLGCIVRLHSPSLEFPDGIVHGDIAPGNIVVDRNGQPRLIDFELSHSDTSKSTVVPTLGMTPAYAAPELRYSGNGPRNPDAKASKKSDVFGVGAVLLETLQLPHVRRAAGHFGEMLLPLCKRMISRSPEERPSASAALAASELTEALEQRMDDRLGEIEKRLRDAAEETRRAEAKRMEVQAARSRVDAEAAALERQKKALRAESAETAEQLKSKAKAVADAAAARQTELEQRAKELYREAERVTAEQRRLKAEVKEVGAARRHAKEEEDKLRAEQAKMKEVFCVPPKHWSCGLKIGQGWRAVAVPPASAVFTALTDALRPDPKYFKPSGIDFQEPGTHTKLVLKCAWRIEDPLRWQQYALARSAVLSDLKDKRLPVSDLRVRQEIAITLGPRETPLPELLQHSGGLNEVRLLHATSPAHVLAILSDGFNPRLAGSTAGTAFGAGSYMAEDAGKCDQYATSHVPGKFADLERRLYRDGVAHPGTKVYYCIVCRVTAGCFALTKDGHKQVDGKQLWAAEPTAGWVGKGADPRRELDYAPGSDAHRARYSSLVVETGPGHTRYREFVVFDPQRMFPEYVLAYTRE